MLVAGPLKLSLVKEVAGGIWHQRFNVHRREASTRVVHNDPCLIKIVLEQERPRWSEWCMENAMLIHLPQQTDMTL